MKQRRSPRQVVKMWQRREKSAVDRVAGAVGGDVAEPAASTHSAYTPSGLSIEDQLRKAWRPWTTGLATF